MGYASELTQNALIWGRWLLVAALVALIVYRYRRSLDFLQLGRECALGAFAYFAYFGVRAVTEGSEARAVENAGRLIDVERQLGILWEPAWQEAIVGRQTLVTLANWAYIWGHWPLIALIAIWLFIKRPATYRLFRNAFIISGVIGLVIFMTFPVAPPRLAGMDVVDTVSEYSRAYRVLQPPSFVNQYAAVPSLHFGWNLLLGIALVRESRLIALKLAGTLLPVVMFLAILLTANHYILDAVAGGAVALVGLLLAQSLSLPGRRPEPTGQSALQPAQR